MGEGRVREGEGTAETHTRRRAQGAARRQAVWAKGDRRQGRSEGLTMCYIASAVLLC